jgi:hypothetical protein
MPKEIVNQVRALMRQGHSESGSYAIAVAAYEKRHGHAPRMHGKLAKAPSDPSAGFDAQAKINSRSEHVLRESNDTRNQDFIMHPELIAAEQLLEMKKIRRLLEQISKTKTL